MKTEKPRVFAKKDLVILQVKYTDSIDVHTIKYTR